MEPAPKKQGRPKLFLIKEMVQERGSSQHCSGSSNSGGFVGGNKSFNKVITIFMKIRMFRGDISGNNIAHEEHENVEPHIGGTSDTGDLSGSNIAREEHENSEAHVGGTSDAGDSNSILDMGKQDQTCGFCEAQVWVAEFTGRYVGTGPKGYSICYGKGKVQLPFLRETPSELGELLTSGSRFSRMFFPKSRVYNNIFAFYSFGGKIDDSVNKGKGPYVFRVSGETYHNFGSLVALDSCAPKFVQIYMYDGQETIDHRVNFVGTKDVLDPTIIATLQEMLNRENFLVGVFNQAQQRFDGVDEILVRLRLLERRTTDGRFENIPTQNDHELNLAYTGDPMDAIINEVYGDLQQMHGGVEYLRDRALLTPLNEFVESVNNSVLHRFPGDFRVYKSCDSICKASSGSAADEVLYPPKYLNSLKFSGVPNHEIHLKVGAPIMLLHNLNPKKGLCNGTRVAEFYFVGVCGRGGI
ncbi:hypothetical protein POM88_016090 [Heracleum sosnowskyi]|uniref:DNA helicase Pif1-like 2B domain-containing protein n=1 Tax=Heracleum sosnowskyi TaxID=360622 RepID=A0AAD8IP42_9APIA|nr:hypothetical protein POM88_016090 [Heracleum sosnowskyi]